jgi:superfamily I DNA/RNA helicase
VHLLTYHGAKGLEFEVVLLPRLEERELPSKQAKSEAEVADERPPLLRRADEGRSGS